MIKYIFLLLPLYSFGQKIEAENFTSSKGVTVSSGKVQDIETGDYMDYLVNLPAGNYTLRFHAATPYSGRKFNLLDGVNLIGSVSLQKSSWTTFTDNDVQVNLTSPITTLRIQAATSYQDLDWFEIIPANKPPIVYVGRDTTIKVKFFSRITIQGQVTDDDNFQVSWVKLSGPAIDSVRSDTLVYDIPLVTPGEYVFKLSAIDSKGGVGSDTIKINIVMVNYIEVHRIDFGEMKIRIYQFEDGTFGHGFDLKGTKSPIIL